MSLDLKTCSICGKEKPLSQFSVRSQKEGRRPFSMCKPCRNLDPDERKTLKDRRIAVEATGGRLGEPPDFLSFRKEHFAYVDMRDGRVKRARNNWFQKDAERQLERHKRLIMVLPPGHMKTTLFSVERAVWSIMRDRNWRGLSVMKSAPEAVKVVNAVQERLDCDYYHHLAEQLQRQGNKPIACPVCLYGGDDGFKPASKSSGEKWGQQGFRVVGRTSGEKDDTFQAKGVGSQILGVRSDRITLDDVQDPMEGMHNPADSQKLLDWVHAVILGRVYDHQQVVFLANFYSPDDFAHKLIAAHPDWPLVTYPAILDEEKEQVLAPEVWSFPGLKAKEKEVGPQVWHFTWQQEEGSFDDQTFKRDVLNLSRNEEFTLGMRPFQATDVFIGCDPAQAASGHCSIVVWGFNRSTKMRYLIDVFNKAGMRNWDNVVEQIVTMSRQYQPVRKIIIERRNTQGAITENDRYTRDMRGTGAQIGTYKTFTGAGATSEQSNFDITTIGRLFDDGLVTLPYGGTFEDQRRIDDYIDQLCAWRTDPEGRSIKHLKRDMVMATLFAESEAFVLANKPEGPKTHQLRKAPRWVNAQWKRKQRKSA